MAPVNLLPKAGEYSQSVGVGVALDDLVLMTIINEKEIMQNLRKRADRGIIYTYIGHVLLAMNPYKKLPIYGKDFIQGYTGRYRVEMPPHIYSLAEETFRDMLTEEEPQCIIISGESGAGKTESAKLIMNYIANVCGSAKGGVDKIKDIVLQSNPLLEAFGNAKTLRNNNSSRFGKYVEILFDRHGYPRGGRIRNYLLEKSRIPSQTKGERNFHIFYQFCKGMEDKDRQTLGLGSAAGAVKAFRYLSLAGCTSLEGVDDAAEFRHTVHAMKVANMGGKTARVVFSLLAAILHLGNVAFEPASADGSTSRVSQDAQAFLDRACDLLKIDGGRLVKALTTRHIRTRGESFDVPLNAPQASNARDAVTKTLYFRAFDWIVGCVNSALAAASTPADGTADAAADPAELLAVCVLDIYGFEIFKSNGFEQFLINYVNEKLQQIFIELTLKAEQEEYEQEKIQWTPIKFFNNKVVCDLIEAKKPQPGVLAILDDTCATLHADTKNADSTFVGKATTFHSQHAHFMATDRGFVIKHYAGNVEYTSRGFCDANLDSLFVDLVAVLAESRHKLLSVLFPQSELEELQQQEGRKRPTTVGHKMKTQCAQLVTDLMATNPHYVRCLKPNDTKQAGVFDDARIEHQCKYLGLLENVRVRRAGFAYRQDFHRFNHRYLMLLSDRDRARVDRPGVSDRDVSKAMLKLLMPQLKGVVADTEFQLGTTKMFIKQPESVFAVEQLRVKHLDGCAARIQRAWRAFLQRRHFIKLRLGAVKYLSKRKERRRDTLLRPFTGIHLPYHSTKDERMCKLRQCLADCTGLGVPATVGQVIYADNCKVLRVNGTGMEEDPCTLVLSTSGVYIAEWRQLPAVMQKNMVTNVVWAGAHERLKRPATAPVFAMRRHIPLSLLDSVSLSPYADNVIVLHVKDRPNGTPPVWTPNSDVVDCARCKRKFWLFLRRHHCRQCGTVYCDECVPEGVGCVPDRSIDTPVRICVGCWGRESLDAWQDYAIVVDSKTELMALLMDASGMTMERSGLPPIKANIAPEIMYKGPSTVSAGSEVATRSSRRLQFTRDPRMTEMAVRVTGAGTISVGPGVPVELVEQQRKAEARRRKERLRRLEHEAEQRRLAEQQRAEAREKERKRRIKEKKARRAAERATAAETSAAEASVSAEKKAKREARKKKMAKAAPVQAVAVVKCGDCGCDDFQPHTFKKNTCNVCYHDHAATSAV